MYGYVKTCLQQNHYTVLIIYTFNS